MLILARQLATSVQSGAAISGLLSVILAAGCAQSGSATGGSGIRSGPCFVEVTETAINNRMASSSDAKPASAVQTVAFGVEDGSGQLVHTQLIELAQPETSQSDRPREESPNPDQGSDSTDTDAENGDDTQTDEGNATDSQQESSDPSDAVALSVRQPSDYFVRQALAAHPSIRAARQRVIAELNRIPQVRALPDPTFKDQFWPITDQALQTAGGRVVNQMSLQQDIPLPAKLRTKAAIVSREVQIARAEVEKVERQITEAVRLAYYEVWYAARAIEIIEETRDLVSDLTQVAEARYRAGGTQQDVLRAQLETDRLEEELVRLRRQQQVSQADLAALVQQPLSLLPQAIEELDLTDVPTQLDELIGLAEACNPSLRGIAAEIQRDRQRQRLACLQQYPDFTLGISHSIISDDNDAISPVANGHDNLAAVFGFTLPIYREKINAGIREAAARTGNSVERLQAERNEIYGRLRGLLVRADALVEQAEIFSDRIIPRTEDTLKLAIADYRGKRTDFFSLIETYRELLMFETQLARVKATLAGTLAEIERTVGCPYEN